jgi:hypothetical protein
MIKDRRRKFLLELGKELAMPQIKRREFCLSPQGYCSVHQITGPSARNQETEGKQGTGSLQCMPQKQGQEDKNHL